MGIWIGFLLASGLPWRYIVSALVLVAIAIDATYVAACTYRSGISSASSPKRCASTNVTMR
jgi:cell division protein FtsW (lipid II flippase)